MKNLMFVENKGEASKVEAFFETIRAHLDAGRSYEDAVYYDEERKVFSDFTEGGVCIPYGSLVYVYRNVGGGEAVYDAYSFGYRGKFAVEKDIEGDLAGLANLGEDFFPTI